MNDPVSSRKTANARRNAGAGNDRESRVPARIPATAQAVNPRRKVQSTAIWSTVYTLGAPFRAVRRLTTPSRTG